jgi:hypothetical protein
MTTESFRLQLAALIDRYLSEDGDPWWMAREINQAAMQSLDELRCDLIETDEPAPY